MLFYIRKLWSYISLFLFRGVLSDKDIKKLLGYHIFIYPFKKENLKPSSYNLTASKVAFIKYKGEDGKVKQKLIVNDDKIIIPPGETAIIETNESIYVSRWIAGTYHSKVKLVNKGLSHIGTTLDPCYFGLSAIAITNNSGIEQEIKVNESIVTIMFYTLKSRSSGLHDNITGRMDNLSLKFDEYIEKDYKKTNEEINKFKNEDYVLKKEVLIQKVREKIKCENILKDICIYSILCLLLGFGIIGALLYLVKNKLENQNLVDAVVGIIQIVPPTIVIIITIIINYKNKNRGEF